jgi:signal transduction histidine kinase
VTAEPVGALPRRAARIPAEVAAVCVLFTGAVVLTGWLARRVELIQFRAGQVPMQFNTAVVLVLLGVSLLLVLSRWFRVAAAPLALSTAFGALTLAQYATGRSLGIDTLLFTPWLTVGTDVPGRMARNTAVCVTVLGAAALWLVLSGRRGGAAALAVGVASSFVGALALVAVFGYAGGVSTAYTWRTSTAMAPMTAIALLLLAVGYVSAAWGAAATAGPPRWLPVPVGVCALATTLLLWQALVAHSTDDGATISVERAAGAVLAIGLVFSALLAVATALGQDARRRRRTAERLSREIEAEAARRAEVQDVLVKRAARDTVLRAAYAAVSSAPDLRRGFDAFVAAAADGIAFDRGSLSLVEEGGTRVVAVSGENVEAMPVGTTVPADDPLVAAILQAQEPYLDCDVTDDTAVRLGIRSFVAAPVVVAGEPRAVLRFASPRPGAFTDEDRELAGELVNVVGGSLYTLATLEDERRTTARLRELDQLKNEFVGVVAHDLRSPMTVIAGYVDTVLQRWDVLPDDMKRELLAVASRNTRRLSVLVEDVLQVARIESGDFPYEIKPFDLAALVARTVDEMTAARPERPVRAVVDPALPRVRGDEDRLWRVLTNLVSNAQKFSPDGEPVVVSAGACGDYAEVRVADRGPGIAPEDMPRLFGKFSRLASSPDGEKGTGLGLYICKALVEAQGGQIGAESRVGSGTTMRFTVPLAKG